MKAFHCYRAAAQFCSPQDAEFAELIGLFKSVFRHGAELLDVPLQEVRIPFEEGYLPGYFLPAEHLSTRAATLIVIGGADTYCEDLYALAGLTGRRRGYHTLMVDLPGQGDTPLQGLYFTYDYERSIKLVVDHLMSLSVVDPARIAIIGLSAGGYAVTRAVSIERRISACIANTPILDIGSLARAEIPRVLAGSSPSISRAIMGILRTINKAGAVNLEKFLWQAGAESLDHLFDILQHGTVDPDGVECAFLSLVAEGDPAEALRQAQLVHASIQSSAKAYRLFHTTEGAEAHCQVSNLTVLNQEVYNWLDTPFSDHDASRTDARAKG